MGSRGQIATDRRQKLTSHIRAKAFADAEKGIETEVVTVNVEWGYILGNEDLLNRDVWNGGFEVEAVVMTARDRIMKKDGMVELDAMLLKSFGKR